MISPGQEATHGGALTDLQGLRLIAHMTRWSLPPVYWPVAVLGVSAEGTGGRSMAVGWMSGVTWLLTNIPRRAAEIPMTAPVWLLLQCHHWKAMPIAIKARMMACVAAGSFLTQVTIAIHALVTQAFLPGAFCVGNSSADIISVGTDLPPSEDFFDATAEVAGHPGWPGEYLVRRRLRSSVRQGP